MQVNQSQAGGGIQGWHLSPSMLALSLIVLEELFSSRTSIGIIRVDLSCLDGDSRI
jgi:hypothetical protein